MRKTILLSALAAMLAAPAFAAIDLDADTLTVNDAKDVGLLGEQADGYLGAVRGDPDAAIMGAAAEINMLRRADYRKAAAGGSSEQAEAEKGGKRNIDALPAGQFYKPAGGNWTKK